MTTNSKEVQSRADAKRAGKRARCWQCLVYEDSAKDNWLNILREYMLETLISPLHDMDVNEDGKTKEPHRHVLISFKNPHSYKDAIEVFDSIGGRYPDPEINWKLFTKQCRVRDFQIAARYHCHLDDADKHLYSMDDEIVFGAVDYIALCLTKADVDEMLGEIFEFMDAYAVRSYPQMVRYTKMLHPEWTRLVFSKCVRQIVDYAKGINFEIEKGVGTYLPEDEKDNAMDSDEHQ